MHDTATAESTLTRWALIAVAIGFLALFLALPLWPVVLIWAYVDWPRPTEIGR